MLNDLNFYENLYISAQLGFSLYPSNWEHEHREKLRLAKSDFENFIVSYDQILDRSWGFQRTPQAPQGDLKVGQKSYFLNGM